MKKLPLKLRNCPESSVYWFDRLDEILKINRKLQVIDVSSNDPFFYRISKYSEYDHIQMKVPDRYQEEFQAIMKVLSRHGSQIRKFAIYKVKLDSPNDFVKLLEKLPLLEELEITELTFVKRSEEAPPDFQPAHLKLLKSLKAISSDSILFKQFTAPHIESLQIFHSKSESGDFMGLLQSDKFDSLEIDKSVKFFKLSSSVPHLKLKKLSLHSVPRRNLPFRLDEDEEADFIKFLQLQVSTLVHLELEGVYKKEVYQIVLSRIKHLKILKVSFEHLPEDEEFYAQLQPLTGLKELHCFLKHPSMASALGMCGKCPNIENLSSPHAEVLPFVAINNPLLTVLSVPYLSPKSEGKFKHLKVLKLQEVLNLERLTKFFANNPTVDTLHTELRTEDKEDEYMEELMSIPTLKHLQLQGDFKAMRRFYDMHYPDYMIENSFMGLKSLRLIVQVARFETDSVLLEVTEGVGLKAPCEYFDKRTIKGALRKVPKAKAAVKTRPRLLNTQHETNNDQPSCSNVSVESLISKLPAKHLMDIFMFLDAKTLKTAALVSKK